MSPKGKNMPGDIEIWILIDKCAKMYQITLSAPNIIYSLLPFSLLTPKLKFVLLKFES